MIRFKFYVLIVLMLASASTTGAAPIEPTLNESSAPVFDQHKSLVIWDTQNLKGTGQKGEYYNASNGEWYFTYTAAIKVAKTQGKRLPTIIEFKTLVVTPYRWIISSGDETKQRSNNKLLLPPSGFRSSKENIYYDVAQEGYYWSSTTLNFDRDVSMMYVTIDKNNVVSMSYDTRNLIYTVRCVQDIEYLPTHLNTL